MKYTDKHKMFLQVVMHQGVIHEDEIKELAIKLFSNDNVIAMIRDINRHLQPLNMIVKDATCEVTGATYWMLTSTVLDDRSRFQSRFSKAQLSLLREIFSKIITSAKGSASSTVCLNLCSTLDTKLSKADAEDFLNTTVKKQWLILKNGQYHIGVRSIAELMPYFRSAYQDLFSTCLFCKQVIFYGERCAHCQSLMHKRCLSIYASDRCPDCNKSMFSGVDTGTDQLTESQYQEEA